MYKILIELNGGEMQLLTQKEFKEMNDELDEYDGIHPYIILGYLYDTIQK